MLAGHCSCNTETSFLVFSWEDVNILRNFFLKPFTNVYTCIVYIILFTDKIDNYYFKFRVWLGESEAIYGNIGNARAEANCIYRLL